jgi:hypothetical protein
MIEKSFYEPIVLKREGSSQNKVEEVKVVVSRLSICCCSFAQPKAKVVQGASRFHFSLLPLLCTKTNTQSMNTKVIEFLTNNPNSNKAQIAEAIGGMKGLQLFNLLKKMVTDGQIILEGDGADATYHVAPAEVVSEAQPETVTPPDAPNTESTEVTVANDGTTEQGNETAGEQPEQTTETQTKVETKPTKATTSRNTGTFKFAGSSYNKGKLINAVVTAHVAQNKNINVEKLRLAFPDTLLKRFGIFQTVEKAREISGPKYDRYFFKDDLQIKLKDAVIVTCNQITSDNLLPFLEQCSKLGIVIEAE